MKPKTSLFTRLAAVGAFTLSALSLQAQTNPNFSDGDLVLYFQRSGAQQVMMSLGNSVTVFRNATPYSVTSLGNVKDTLDVVYGTGTGATNGWVSSNRTFMGAVGFIPLTDPPSTLDVTNSIYISKSRNTPIGTPGLANSSQFLNINNINGAISSISQNLNYYKTNQSLTYNADDDIYDTTNGTAFSQISVYDASQVPNTNPLTTVTLQATAYTAFTGGVQTQFASGNLGSFGGGSWSGTATNVEAALDLFRIDGSTAGSGSYMGTLTLSNDGSLNFFAVPEPSSLALLAIGGAFALYRRHRQNKLNS